MFSLFLNIYQNWWLFVSSILTKMMRNLCFLERKYNIVVTPPAEVSKWTLPPSFSFRNFSEEKHGQIKWNFSVSHQQFLYRMCDFQQMVEVKSVNFTMNSGFSQQQFRVYSVTMEVNPASSVQEMNSGFSQHQFWVHSVKIEVNPASSVYHKGNTSWVRSAPILGIFSHNGSEAGHQFIPQRK